MNRMLLGISILFAFVVAGGVYYGWSLFESMAPKPKAKKEAASAKEKKIPK